MKEEEDEESTVAALERADREDHRRDVHPFDGEGLLGAVEASKLLGECQISEHGIKRWMSGGERRDENSEGRGMRGEEKRKENRVG